MRWRIAKLYLLHRITNDFIAMYYLCSVFPPPCLGKHCAMQTWKITRVLICLLTAAFGTTTITQKQNSVDLVYKTLRNDSSFCTYNKHTVDIMTSSRPTYCVLQQQFLAVNMPWCLDFGGLNKKTNKSRRPRLYANLPQHNMPGNDSRSNNILVSKFSNILSVCFISY